MSQYNDEHILWNSRTQNLSINCEPALGYPCTLLIAGWQHGTGWKSRLDNETYLPAPYEEHGFDLLSPTRNKDILEWQNTIPDNVLQQLHRFKKWRYALLQLVRQSSAALDLLLSNPLLLWLTWDFGMQNSLSNQELRHTLTLKQRDILRKIGLHGSRSASRMLCKVEFNDFNIHDRDLLRSVWCQESLLKQMTHMEKLNLPLLRFFSEIPWIAGTPLARFFDQMDCQWQQKELEYLIRDSLRMRWHLLEISERQLRYRLSQCRSYEAVERIHNRLAESMNQYAGYTPEQQYGLTGDDGSLLPFPEPPHPGTEFIQPIVDASTLAEEGKKMNHCVRSYTQTVQSGEYYVYHMDKPEPLTIGVHIHQGKMSILDQIRGKRNRRASTGAIKIIEDWFAEAISSR